MDFGFYFLEFTTFSIGSSKIAQMALRSPRRLPKSFNRQTSVFSRSIARMHYGTADRRARRRHERRVRFMKRCSRIFSLVATEFRAWILIGIGTIALSILLALLFSPFFDVRQIMIQRQDPRIDPSDVQQVLAPLFRQRLILITKSQVASLLLTQYPDIERIDIVKQYPSTLSVSITMEPVVARVLIDNNDASQTQTGALLGSGSYAYITRSGYFVSTPMKLSGKIPIPILRFTDWGFRPQNRTRVILPDFIDRIFTARDVLRTDFGLSTIDIVVYVRAQEFHIRTNKVSIWFDLKSPMQLQFQRFRQFLKTLSLDQAKVYIDLRIADKIIFQ